MADTRDHREDALYERATVEIAQMSAEGYTEGELLDNIRMNDADGEGVGYRGHWTRIAKVIA